MATKVVDDGPLSVGTHRKAGISGRMSTLEARLPPSAKGPLTLMCAP